MIYADPSFLFSLYCVDKNSVVANRTYQADRRRPLCFTAWQRFELCNAVRLSVHRLRRAKSPVPFQPGQVFKHVQDDLDAGRLRHADVDWRESFRLAEALSAAHTEQCGAASVDVWHVAAAQLLAVDTYWTFDHEQWQLAKNSGIIRNVPELAP